MDGKDLKTEDAVKDSAQKTPEEKPQEAASQETPEERPQGKHSKLFDGINSFGKIVLEFIFIAVLVIYPMRHVDMGIDFWDVGYNYGNFVNPGVGPMGKMWFFSTYLATNLGHLLTLLPHGTTLLGLNIYTGLFSSILAVMGYLYFTRALKVSPVLVFAGEMAALSMCWCPTALLYNYLTYVLFSGSVILLWLGLGRKKHWMLALAGACLGINVFVRFSNLPEMGLILAVWVFAFFEAREGLKKGDNEATKGNWIGIGFGNVLKYTLWCLAGYLGALLLVGGWIAMRYGIDEYVDGIKLLFAMTDTAADYKPTSMIASVIWQYKEAMYWVLRLGFFAVLAMAIRFITDQATLMFAAKEKKGLGEIFGFVGIVGVSAVTLLMVYWMFLQRQSQPNLTSFYYTSYDPIYWLGTLFLMLAMAIGFLELVRPGSSSLDRFLGMAVILLILLTSLGSNNGIYPSMNHLFLPAPYLLWKMGEFTMHCLKWSTAKPENEEKIKINFTPLCVTIWAFLFVCGMQFFLFGRYFVFCEGTGMQEKGYEMNNNPVLKGIQMGQERALYVSDVTLYANAADLAGQEVIIHGKIPAMAFYLQMKPAFHSWNDLASFSYETMQETMDELMSDISEKGRKKPVVLAIREYEEFGPILPEEAEDVTDSGDPKWELIRRYMGLFGYEETFKNGWFTIWEAAE
ncbi:MAG: hypothetical protein IKS85_08580 [Lachnospiraceae bacterium]|nr:hypothetical protein [Lachnospiraceae bacterium]